MKNYYIYLFIIEIILITYLYNCLIIFITALNLESISRDNQDSGTVLSPQLTSGERQAVPVG